MKRIDRIFVIGKNKSYIILTHTHTQIIIYKKCSICSRETLSRRSSVSHLTHDVMSSFGSYTSLSFRSTGNGEGAHRSNRHSPHKHSHSHYHHRHHNHNHHYHGQNSTRKHQVYYQTHHALCKRAFSGESQGGKLNFRKTQHPIGIYLNKNLKLSYYLRTHLKK